MTSRKIVAVFDTGEAAQRARASLVECGIEPERISISDRSSSSVTTQTPEHRGTFWAHVKELFMPDSDRETLEESMRRGGCVLVASVDDARADEAIARLDAAGAVDLEQRESEWRSAGWNAGGDATREPPRDTRRDTPGDTLRDGRPDAVAATESQTIPVVRETLRVGKREVNRGGVRVRSYIVEEPVHEEVRLREERVRVERRPIDEPARAEAHRLPGDPMQERTIEVSETAEQAVVGKEARITEEVVITKEAGERIEQIDDTVRHTEVEVERGNPDQVQRRPAPPNPERTRRT